MGWVKVIILKVCGRSLFSFRICRVGKRPDRCPDYKTSGFHCISEFSLNQCLVLLNQVLLPTPIRFVFFSSSTVEPRDSSFLLLFFIRFLLRFAITGLSGFFFQPRWPQELFNFINYEIFSVTHLSRGLMLIAIFELHFLKRKQKEKYTGFGNSLHQRMLKQKHFGVFRCLVYFGRSSHYWKHTSWGC